MPLSEPERGGKGYTHTNSYVLSTELSFWSDMLVIMSRPENTSQLFVGVADLKKNDLKD